MALAGTTWSLVAFGGSAGADGGDPPLAGSAITLRFEDQGDRLSGSAGCNLYSGAYTERGNDLTVASPLATTMRYCADPEGLMDQEGRYLMLIEAAQRYAIQQDRLTITSAIGSIVTQLTFVPTAP